MFKKNWIQKNDKKELIITIANDSTLNNYIDDFFKSNADNASKFVEININDCNLTNFLNVVKVNYLKIRLNSITSTA